MIKSRKSCWKYDTAHAWHYWLARRSDECAEQCYKRASWINSITGRRSSSASRARRGECGAVRGTPRPRGPRPRGL